MILEKSVVLAVMPLSASRVDRFLEALQKGCERYGIDTPARIAAFLATIAHESGELKFVREIASGEAYEGRKDLGNTEPGDGRKFAGRGLIQITGRDNYAKVSAALGTDYVAYPELLERDEDAALASCWWWKAHGCNELADTGSIEAVTRRVNGGQNGIDSRRMYYARAQKALEAAPIAAPPSPPTPISLPIPSPASKEKPVAPFVALAVSSIVNAVPDLIKIFGDKESAVAERNTKAAERVVEIAKETLGAANEQEVVERVESDPAAAEQVRAAVRSEWFELQTASAESIQAAAKRNEVYLEPGATPAYKTPAMQISLVVMFFVSMILVDMLFVHVDNYSPDMKAFVIGAIIGSGFSGVLAYFIGSSDGSKRAGETVRKIALKH